MADRTPCPRCRETYRNGRPSHFGSDPQCAFPGGDFDERNWNCITANEIRDHTFQDEEGSRAQWSEDSYLAVLPWPERGTWLVVEWYKHRGCTERVMVYDCGELRPATLEDAEAYLADSADELKTRTQFGEQRLPDGGKTR